MEVGKLVFTADPGGLPWHVGKINIEHTTRTQFDIFKSPEEF